VRCYLTRWLIPLPAIVLAFWPTVVSAIEVPPNPYYNAPQNLTTESAANNGITVKWDVPEVSNYDRIDIYVVEFYKLTDGVESGGWAVWTEAENHAYTFGSWIYNYTGENLRFKVKAGSDACVGRPDPIGYCLYGEKGSVDAVISNPATTTTLSTTTTSSTSTSTTTTTPATSTTVEESTTTTSTSSSTTTLPQETTTTTEQVQIETTTSVADTTTTTTTTVAPAPTTTQAPYTPPQTTTSSSTTSLPEPSTTTTTVLPEPEPTVEETSTTTYPVAPDPTVPVSRPVQSSVVPTLPAETTTPSTQPSPGTSIQETLRPVVESSSTTTLPVPDKPISDTKVAEILTELKDAAPAQIVAAINQVLTSNITSDQAVSIASSAEVLEAVTEEQAEAIFEEIVVEELSAEVAEELVEVVNEAPTKVKEAFQETINVFAGVFDSYQMVGQTIPVGERRTLVAVSNTLVAVGASLRRRR
jgi:hypothetical protein